VPLPTVPSYLYVFVQRRLFATSPVGKESVPIQLAQCWFHGLAFSNAEVGYIFQIKYTEAISNSTRKLLWFEISKMMIAVRRNKFIASFITIFGTLSFPVAYMSSLRP